MGLAASQARFLGLTARKSNVEYQAQQINQARTALANEVSGLHREYNSLKPPVTPTIQDYTEITYVLDQTYQQYEIDSFTRILDGGDKGNYDVVLKYNKEIPEAYSYIAEDSIIERTIGPDGSITKLNFQIGSSSYYYDPSDDKSTITKIVEGDNYAKYPGLETVINSGELTTPPFFMFKRGDKAYYTSEAELLAAEDFDKDGKRVGDYTFYYGGTKLDPQTVKGVAAIEQGTNGRITSISFIDCEDPALIDHEYTVKTSKTQNQDEYNDAMNNYNYENAVYQKELQRINMQTEDLQQQDKNLELQLNQLDTEQNAIKTEMDSVTKVIEDTIESVFKTFN